MASPGKSEKPNGSWSFFATLGLLLLGLSLQSGAQPPNPVDQLLIGEGGSIQTAPDLARLAAPGHFVVVWTNVDPVSGESGIAARRVGIPEGPLGPEFLVDPGLSASTPSVAAAPDGGFLVVWQEPGTSTVTGDFDTAILARRYDAEGQPLANELLLASSTASVGDIEVGTGAEGDFVVAWRATPSPSEGRVYAARFAADGSPHGDATVVSDPAQNALGHALAVNPGGSFVVVWNRGGAAGGTNEAIEGRRFDAEGAPVGEPFVVQDESSVDRFRDPAVATGRDGRFVVAWSNEDTALDETSIRIRQFSAEALPLIGELQVNNGDFADFYTYLEPDVAVAEDERFLVVWRRLAPVDGGAAVQGKVYSPNASLRDDFLIADFVTSSRRDPQVATGAGSDFVVTWSTDGSDVAGTGYANTTNSEILGRSYSLPCPDDPTQSCLLGERFQVAVTWRDFAGNAGVASQVPADSDGSTLLWFFEEANWEMLVKMVDGCGFNGHYWLFAAATTNVETTLTVTDTLSGEVRVYTNPLGQASAAVTDVTAFPTCD